MPYDYAPRLAARAARRRRRGVASLLMLLMLSSLSLATAPVSGIAAERAMHAVR